MLNGEIKVDGRQVSVLPHQEMVKETILVMLEKIIKRFGSEVKAVDERNGMTCVFHYWKNG